MSLELSPRAFGVNPVFRREEHPEVEDDVQLPPQLVDGLHVLHAREVDLEHVLKVGLGRVLDPEIEKLHQ